MLSRKSIGRIVARWTTELLVVFVGVYGAFALAEWEEGRDLRDRANQVRAALVKEIRGIQSNTYPVAVTLPPQLARIDSLMAAGRTFRLTPQMEAIGFRTHVWDATLAGSGLALFDVESFLRISEFYNDLNAGFEHIAQMRNLSETMLLPALDSPADSFFEPDPDRPGAVRLRPQYQWYLDGLRRFARVGACITIEGDSVLAHFGEMPDTSRAPLDPEGC